MKRLAPILVAVVIAACSTGKSSPTEADNRLTDVADNAVTAERVSEGVRVTNGSGANIRLLVKNAAWLGLLAGCHHEPSSCTLVGARQSVVVKWTDVAGFHSDAKQLEVWYWVAGSDEPIGKVIQLD
jgi:hypothetical protein